MLIIWISCAKRSGSGIYPTHFYRFFRLFLHFIFALTGWDELDWPSHDRPFAICLRGGGCAGQSRYCRGNKVETWRCCHPSRKITFRGV